MKPGDFFVGVLDFFAVLIPGSLAAWLAIQYVPASSLRAMATLEFMGADAKPELWMAGVAFALLSYLIGQFVFIAASRLDTSYDRWRMRVHHIDRDETFKAAKALKQTLTPQLNDSTLTTLKWSLAYIQATSAQSRVEIDRLEAEQKFFRSMVVVAVVFAAHFVFRDRAVFAGTAALIIAALSYWRYRDRRWAMTELIFATAVVVHTVSESGSSARPKSRGGKDGDD